MSEKKPVWVDEEAHAILKRYGTLTKKSMADVTSDLVLEHLSSLSAEAPSMQEAAPVEAVVEVPVVEVSAPSAAAAEEPVVQEAEPTEAIEPEVEVPARVEPRRRRRRVEGDEDTSVRYLGGIWLV